MGIYHPVSTYRLQFNGGFTFRDAESVLKYLAKLGIRTIYASPVFRAVTGSTHGYDVTDPLSLNKEIGSEDDLQSLIRALHRRKMGWLQDVVPNHMGYSSENPWVNDLLIKGPSSKFHRYFDLFTDYSHGDLPEVVMMPFLGRSLEEVIRDREFSLDLDKQGFFLSYYSHRFPLSMDACPEVLRPEATGPENQGSGPPGKESSGQIPAGLLDLYHRQVDPDQWEARMEALYKEYLEDSEVTAYIDRMLDHINGDSSGMQRVVSKLVYLPVHWKETEQRINYRRFFTINGLICLRMEDPEVFSHYHRRIGQWVEKGWFDGLRIDHVDGLYDPAGYLDRVRALCGKNSYLVVEKILEKEETLPASWKVDGTTGYDFLAQVNNLLTQSNNAPLFFEHYRHWTGSEADPEAVFAEKKRFILHHRLKGELELLVALSLETGWFESQPVRREHLREAIAEFMIQCPLYRIYNDPSVFTRKDRQLVSRIMEKALTKRSLDPEVHQALSMLGKMWLESATTGAETRRSIDHLFRRVMQFTGPLMAKGLEDTAYYAYHPFLGHNEVGDSPDYFGITTEEFHRRMIHRRDNSPLAMNTLSTHDTKRGEDARARLQVLSDLPESWKKVSTSWRHMNENLKERQRDEYIPSPEEEYLIYQALLAHAPMECRVDDSFIDRFREYLIKALREAKENTSWSTPDTLYEDRVLGFVERILDPSHSFRSELEAFLERIAPHGIINSLTQSILKLTVPGVPDTYQGCETWNLSFVDPDNRRPVDFGMLSLNLDQMIRKAARGKDRLMADLWTRREDGRIKQWIIHLLLKFRSEQTELFEKGSYIPLEVKGRYKEHVIAFCRRYRNQYALVVLPLHSAGLPSDHRWKNTRVVLPDLSPVRWENLLTGKMMSQDGTLALKELFRTIPFACCKAFPNTPAKHSGILLHITSLPGQFGTGDFGPESFRFVDFLHRAGQRYWQILPLSVTSSRSSFSPYSSESAFAGTALFTDPVHLEETGLLEPGLANKWQVANPDRIDYHSADRVKRQFLSMAFDRFREAPPSGMRERYATFLESEAYWLNDYALYKILKAHFNGRRWFEWPSVYRNRHREALSEFSRLNEESIDRIKFEQFVFSEQWSRVKAYANDRGIEIFGDIPIYIDHDSADLWAHPQFFRLNTDSSLKGVAGVPPDYFNENGQLWGMPLYDWEAMEKDGYSWWIERLRKNLQWFDLLRMDHFRGFEAYWEVTPEESTARNGRWVPGPGKKLFDIIRQNFPGMPFVAEDLGQITREVFQLRDQYGLPGMKVIQFGFGKHMPFSHHYPGNIPYNSIVYTGTHDNNTIRGWFRKEADNDTLERYRSYAGNKLKDKNVHMEMIRLAYGSPARVVIIPMQDWLGLDERSRMNYPSTVEGNWLWRLRKDQITKKLEKQIRKRVRLFGRY